MWDTTCEHTIAAKFRWHATMEKAKNKIEFLERTWSNRTWAWVWRVSESQLELWIAELTTRIVTSFATVMFNIVGHVDWGMRKSRTK